MQRQRVHQVGLAVFAAGIVSLCAFLVPASALATHGPVRGNVQHRHAWQKHNRTGFIEPPAWVIREHLEGRLHFDPTPRARRAMARRLRRNRRSIAHRQRRSVGWPHAGKLPQPFLGPAFKYGEPPLVSPSEGPVQTNPKIFLIFWGSDWNILDTGLKSAIEQFYSGLTSNATYSEWSGILRQYCGPNGCPAANGATIGGVWVDPEHLYPTSVCDEEPNGFNCTGRSVYGEVHRAVYVAGSAWSAEGANPNAQFIVIPAHGATYVPGFQPTDINKQFCGFHGQFENATYTFLPDMADEESSNPFRFQLCGFLSDPNAANAETGTAAHEYAESVTDPKFSTNSAWNAQGAPYGEIADICASGDDQYHSSGMWVQGIWDDHLNRCALYDSNPPPVVPTDPPDGASGVTETGATLNASVNPNGTNTHLFFEWGITPSYGNVAPSTEGIDVGSGTKAEIFSIPISGLRPGTIYHFRSVVYNAWSGYLYGPDQTIKTKSTVSAFATPASQLSDYFSATESSVEAQQSTMAGSASPSLGVAQNGNFYSAYRSSSGALAIYSSTTGTSAVTSSQVMAGSNPSVAAFGAGGYEVAFEATNGTLALYSSATGQTTATSFSIAGGSNPSIAPYANGGFEVAYEGSGADLYVYSSLTGVATDTAQAMRPSTSPSLGILFNNQFVVAYQNSGSKFAVYSSATGTSTVTTTSMTAGTSPSLVVLLSGGYEAAFLSSSGEIWTYESASGKSIPRTQAVAAGTSPSLANIPGEGCKIAFQTNTNFLAIFSCKGGSRKVTTSAMKAGTSPSIVSR